MAWPKGSGIPAKGTRPPFEKGNTLRLKHGARTAKIYQPLAQELACGLLDERPDLEAYPEAVAAWSEAEARAQLLRAHLAEVGLLDPDSGEVREGAAKWLRWMEKDAQELRERLGLDPRADAALAKERAQAATLAYDLDGLIATGREVLASGQTAPGVEVLSTTARNGDAHG